MGHDLRFAIRQLRRAPGYAALVIATMALGIGATTTLFSVAYGVLLKPLPWADADRLVRVTESRGGRQGRVRGTISNGSYLAWRDAATTIDAIGGYGLAGGPMTILREESTEPVRLPISRLTASMFDVLRVRPILGRAFTADDERDRRDASENPQVVIVSHELWQNWFGGRRDALGRTLHIDGAPVTIVGVMPRGFAFPDADTRAWLPMVVGQVLAEQGIRRIQIFGALARLRPGVTPQQASAEGTSRARSGADPGLAAVAMFGSTAPSEITATPAIDAMTADVKPAIVVLLTAVALLLLTATANVGGLQIARATTRRREIAVRAAIGAGGGRLMRQLVVESLVVGAAGGLAGLLVALACERALPALVPPDFPRLGDIEMNWRVLVFAAGVSIVTSVVCGLLPALQAQNINLTDALAEGATGSTSGVWRSRTGRLRTAMMAGQVSVACFLLVGALLLTRSFVALIHADRGYDPSNVLTARISLPAAYESPRASSLAETLIERLRAMPAVTHAAAGNALPFLTIGGNFAFRMPSPRDPAVNVQVQAMLRTVTPDYFGALRLRIVQGRALTEADTTTSQRVIVVNRSFARQYISGDPIGARVPLSFDDTHPDAQVVGVVEDMRQGEVTDAPAAEIFRSFRQVRLIMPASLIVLVRSTGDPVALVPTLRAAVREQDPTLAVDSIMTMEERVMTSLAKPRTYAVLLSAFAVFALVIAAVGLFGLLSYGVAQRSREIGVRTALGAQPADIVAFVLRQACGIVAIGLGAGLWASFVAMRYLASFLYGVTPRDPATFAGVAALLAAAAAAACVVPARRAASVDPIRVLRAG